MNNITPLPSEASLILIVDDETENLEIIRDFLEEEGYESILAENGTEALDLIEQDQPDLILLDFNMPEMNGLQVYQTLKANHQYRETSVIFLATREETETLLENAKEDLVDYITKPIKRLELLTRIRLNLEFQATKIQLEEVLDAQQKLSDNLEKFANTDELTHIANRRYFFSLAYQELQRTRRYERTFSILLFDLDHFKVINDNYGHSLGDQLLQFVVKKISRCLRDTDLFGRFAGEEFVALLPETNLQQAQKVAERIRQAIADLAFPFKKESIHVTISIGVSCYQETDTNLEDILKRADHALMQAKLQGRNKVVTSSDRFLTNFIT